MDIKKSPDANLEDKKFTYLLIGLVAVLSVLFVCFEWTDKEITVYEVQDNLMIYEEEEIEQTQEEEEEPEPPEVEQPEVIEELEIVEDDKVVEKIEILTEDDQDQVQEFIAAPIEEIEEEEVEEVFVVVEQMPEFPGGQQKLMQYFADNVRYPVIAQENGIQGRVICQFTVWKDGSISDIKVVRGGDKSLEKEAIRLIKNMPKWKPGKQRGKAVSCKFTVPVNFVLK